VTLTILYCHCAYAGVIPEETRRTVRAALAHADGRVETVADLCGRAAEGDPLLRRLASADAGPLHVVACYPRAVRWLFEFAGATLPGSATVHNMRTEAAETILRRLGLRLEPASDAEDARRRSVPAAQHPGKPEPAPFPEKPPNGWVPWYPVIDYSRCRSCKQCFEFCIFGAFEVDADGRVRVAHPAKCKLNCPACGRVCPASAIIFPKFPDGGPIAGDEGALGPGAEEGMQTDLDRLGHGNVYEILRRRADQAKAAARTKTAQPEKPDDE